MYCRGLGVEGFRNRGWHGDTMDGLDGDLVTGEYALISHQRHV